MKRIGPEEGILFSAVQQSYIMGFALQGLIFQGPQVALWLDLWETMVGEASWEHLLGAQKTGTDCI